MHANMQLFNSENWTLQLAVLPEKTKLGLQG